MENKNYQTISLKAWRVNKGMSQQDVADRLGVSRPTVIKWEQEDAKNNGLVLYALAKLYDVDIDDIKA